MVIIASTANTNIHQLQTFNSQNHNYHHLRDASFSSYLNEEAFAESSQSFNPLISNRKDPIHQGINKEEDGEIGVFSAEKYFNGGGEVLGPRVAEMEAKKYEHHYQKEEQTALETGRQNGKYGTPSVRSESSSNSQSALLQSSMRDSARNRIKVQRKSFLAGLGSKYCSCSDKNSVDVSDHAGEVTPNKTATYGVDHVKTTPKKHFNADLDADNSVKKITKPHAELLINNKDVYFQKQEKLGVGSNRENSLAFSTENSGLGNQLVKTQIQELEKPRKSLEVFGSPILGSRSNKSMSFDKRLTVPSWDGPPKLEEIDLTANSVSGNYNDAESDASSDLFEIESLTGKSNPLLARRTSDVASGCGSPTTCYAPSEASIEWSVVTASAVEYSTMSDCEDQRSEATTRSPIRPPLASSNGKPKATKEMHRRRPSMLLGCKSQKAVGVAVDAFTTCEKPCSNLQIRRKSDTFAQVTRFQAEAKEENFGARHGQHAYAIAAPPLQRSHSPHASQLLYI